MYKRLTLFSLLAIVAVSTAAQASNSSNNEKPAGSFCQGCRSIVSFLSQYNSSNYRDDYKYAIKSFCELYYPVSTDTRQGPCPFLTEGLFYSMDMIDPVYHCDNIGACEKPNQKVLEQADKSNNIICDACEQLVTQVQGELEDPTVIANIHRQVDAFCEYLAAIDQDKQCLQMLDNYIDEAINFVRKVNPLQYCQSISLCSPTKLFTKKVTVNNNQVVSPSILARYQGFGLQTKVVIDGKVVEDKSKLFQKPKRKATKSPTCMLCKTVITELVKLIKDNRTEESIRDGLDKICGLVYHQHGPKYHECEDMMKFYTKELVELLTDEADPELVCMLLEQCTYQPAPKTVAPKQADAIDVGQFISMLDSSIEVGSMRNCFECKLFIEYLHNAIEEPKSKEYIKNWLLSNLCDSLDDKKLKDSCSSMVHAYADVFFNTLAKELDPKQACVELHACTGKSKPSERVIDATKPFVGETRPTPVVFKALRPTPPVQANAETTVCDQCIDIVTQIDEYLSAHPIDHDVSTLIDQVCNNIPSESAKDQCTFLIKAFGQEIAQAISTMDNPRQLCSRIMFC